MLLLVMLCKQTSYDWMQTYWDLAWIFNYFFVTKCVLQSIFSMNFQCHVHTNILGLFPLKMPILYDEMFFDVKELKNGTLMQNELENQCWLLRWSLQVSLICCKSCFFLILFDLREVITRVKCVRNSVSGTLLCLISKYYNLQKIFCQVKFS